MSQTLLKSLDAFFQKQIELGLILDWGVMPIGKVSYGDELKEWIGIGYHAKMDFMRVGLEKRLDPNKIVDWAKSILIFSIPYPVSLSSKKENRKDECFKIASYAMGLDYHYCSNFITNKLKEFLEKNYPDLKSFPFSDSKPIFERDWATQVGLGWRGKNTFTIDTDLGSGFLLGGILLSESLEKTKVVHNYCGSCRRCLDVCPTQAFVKEGVLDSNRCISYWTIEEKGEVPLELSSSFGEWIFGCDICQEVCPWNEKALRKKGKQDIPTSFQLTLNQWISVLRKGGGFQSRFKGTPLLRAGRRKLLRNLMIVIRNLSAKPDIESILITLENQEEGWVKDEIFKTRRFLNL